MPAEVVLVVLELRNNFPGHDELPKREWHLERARPTYIKDTTRRNTTPSAVAAAAAAARERFFLSVRTSLTTMRRRRRPLKCRYASEKQNVAE